MSSQTKTLIDLVWLEGLKGSSNTVPTLVAVAVVLVTILVYQVRHFHHAT